MIVKSPGSQVHFLVEGKGRGGVGCGVERTNEVLKLVANSLG